MLDPFTTLGVAEDADDALIRHRYLALVRAFPPDRAPARFEEIRNAYELLIDERKRLETTLLHTNSVALDRLKNDLLSAAEEAEPARASKAVVLSLLAEGIINAAPLPAGGQRVGR